MRVRLCCWAAHGDSSLHSPSLSPRISLGTSDGILLPPAPESVLKLGVDEFYRLKSLVDTLLAEPA